MVGEACDRVLRRLLREAKLHYAAPDWARLPSVGSEPSIGCPKAITQWYPGINNRVSACDDPMTVTYGGQHIELAVTELQKMVACEVHKLPCKVKKSQNLPKRIDCRHFLQILHCAAAAAHEPQASAWL